MAVMKLLSFYQYNFIYCSWVSHNQGVTKFALPSKNEGHHGAKVMFLMFCPNPSP